MKNIPFFTSEYGVASLTLEEIPYSARAYITLQDVLDPEAMLNECLSFCRALGAQQVFACNHPFLNRYPEGARIVQMQLKKALLPETKVLACPANGDNSDMFCRIYNEKMHGLPTARHMTPSTLPLDGSYFVYSGDSLIGIGIARGDTLLAVAALEKGAGREVVAALCECLHSDVIRLEVDTGNRKAVSLYRSMGFEETEVRNIWYQIL